MKLSVLIPAFNEKDCLEQTLRALIKELRAEGLLFEVLVVNDNSSDETESILQALAHEFDEIRYLNSSFPQGFGFAVRCGLEKFLGDAVAIYMADASDDPKDLIRFWRELEKGVDCVFGTRWSRGGKVIDYPLIKLVINRLANRFIQLVMRVPYDDFTNAFKLYRRTVIDGLHPILSSQFNLTVELPLKAVVRRYSYTVVHNSWTNRKAGKSKLKIKEMGSRYFFVVMYCLLEKILIGKVDSEFS